MHLHPCAARLWLGSLLVVLLGSLAVDDAAAGLFKRRVWCRPAPRCPQPCPEPTPSVRVRKNINNLTEAELASFKRGVQAMKDLKDADPRSWRFQANIHGTFDAVPPSAIDLFNKCEHRNVYFFVWHRGYIYNFERILRELSGDPKLTLPYWDWETDPTLPVAFRNPVDPAGPNPLYDATRNINDGSALPPNIVVDNTTNALALIPFFEPLPVASFSRRFEGSPHGSVHNLTGGNMTAFETAGQDPIFWLHHCNIDRNLDRWLNRGAGRNHPSDAAFLDTPYAFIDDTGTKINVKVRAILHSATLGYRYEDVPNPTAAAARMAVTAFRQPPAKPKLIRAAASFKDDTAPADAKPLGLKPVRATLHVAPMNMPAWKALLVPARTTGKVFLQISGISVKAPPAFVYDVYLNLPEADLAPEQKRRHYAGTIDFFGKTSHAKKDAGHGAAPASFTEIFDVTATVAALQKAKRWQAEKLSVTFHPLTPIAPKGNEAALQTRLEASARKAEVTYQHVELLFAP
jgi:hypothetical protein